MRKLTILFLLVGLNLMVFAQEKINADMLGKIRKEGFENSKVMDIAFHLTDVSGPRLTNSPGYKRAADWAVSKMKEWGLKNAGLEAWGEFGKGWELQKSYIAMTAPYYRPLVAFPKTWTKGTNGQQQAEILLIDAKDSASLVAYRGKMKGKILLIDRPSDFNITMKPQANRFTDEELEKMSSAAGGPAAPRPPADTAAMRRMRDQTSAANFVTNKAKEWGNLEGAVGILSVSSRGHDGTLFVSGGGSYQPNAPENFLDIMVALEDYYSLARLAKAGKPVKIEVDVKTAFHTADTKGYNVIAEIPGTDPKLKDEIVMLGGHLDSWHSATGATDNAAGCAVMLEAVRILQSLGVKPRRTIRIALWGGEEQGLHGSRNYVKNHFADPATMELKPEHGKFSAYFNMDNGTGKFRGIYLQQNEGVKSIFQQWLEPFKDLGATTVTINNTGGTDHQAFDAVGLPGFQFIQDPIEYNTRTHHTNMDTYDHLIADDLKQNAVIAAAFVYNAAMRDEKLPRKELPKPRGQQPRGF